jgi:hypothetical protein
MLHADMGQDYAGYHLWQDLPAKPGEEPLATLIRIDKDALIRLIDKAKKNRNRHVNEGPISVWIKRPDGTSFKPRKDDNAATEHGPGR